MTVTVDRERIAMVLDTVVATLAGPERLNESRRWGLAAQLTEVRMALDDLTEYLSGRGTDGQGAG